MPPAAIVGGRLAILELVSARLQRLASFAVAGVVLVAVAGELYRAGYKDGYRLADQVAGDRSLAEQLVGAGRAPGAGEREAVG